VTLPSPSDARLYARVSGGLYVVLALLSITFLAGLAWFGIDATRFEVSFLGMGVLGLLLLISKGLGVLLPVAVVAGVVSAAFWAIAWSTSEGLGWVNFAPTIGLSVGGAVIALRGWFLFRPGRSTRPN
jgi:hypothetical protein